MIAIWLASWSIILLSHRLAVQGFRIPPPGKIGVGNKHYNKRPSQGPPEALLERSKVLFKGVWAISGVHQLVGKIVCSIYPSDGPNDDFDESRRRRRGSFV